MCVTIHTTSSYCEMEARMHSNVYRAHSDAGETAPLESLMTCTNVRTHVAVSFPRRSRDH